jgi:hypothetical protein
LPFGFCSLSCRHAEFISVSSFLEQVQILKQVQDDGVVFRITESVLFIIRIFSLSCRHAEFISVSGLCRASTDPETSSG